jgi:peptidoglycan hydrolase CwlO-like protein
MKFNVKKKFFLFTLTSILFLGAVVFVKAQTCNSQDECNSLIQQYSDQISTLQGQAKTLKNQIAQFDAQIKLTTLKIQQTQDQIALLGGRIVQLGDSLTSLTAAFSSRAVETYKLSRFENNFIFILSASDITDATSRLHYLQKIQEEDRNLLNKLQTAQTTYQGQKADQETLQKQLKTQQTNLNAQKVAKNNLLTATKNDESKYQQLLGQAKAQLSAFQNFITRQGGASILSNQTKCNDWGCYYNQRDSQWGNMSLGGSPYSMANYGCLVTSVSMVASHYGKSIKPNDIAGSSDAFVPGTGYLYHSFTANGISVTVSSVSKSIIDSELSAGRPVIAGLYSGPDHFIVITRKDGDKYIMRDPFLEDGAGSDGNGRPLTDKYNFSDITSLRLISFN